MRDEIVPHNPNLVFDEVALRNHHGRYIDPNARLWAIREMAGARNGAGLARAARQRRKWKSNRMAAMWEVAEESLDSHPTWMATVRQYEREDEIAQIANAFDDWLDSVSEDVSLSESADYVAPLAILESIFMKFDPEFLQFVLQRYCDPGTPFKLSSRFRRGRIDP
jgi:hypothetical protein